MESQNHRLEAIETPETRNDESELVRRLRAGDHTVFEILLRRYGGHMLAVARRFLEEQDARDAVQGAMLSALKDIQNFDGQAGLSTWFHRIVVNASLMKLRALRSGAEDSVENLLPRFDEEGKHLEEGSAPFISSEEMSLARRDTSVMVRKCISLLPESHRTVLLLRDIEQMDTEQVANRLNLTSDEVKMRLHQARQALRTILQRELRKND